MDVVCTSPVYTNWRGDTGNYIFIASFTIAFIVNVVVGGAVLLMKTDSKLSKYFLIIYLAANTMVVVSQIVHSGIHLTGENSFSLLE